MSLLLCASENLKCLTLKVVLNFNCKIYLQHIWTMTPRLMFWLTFLMSKDLVNICCKKRADFRHFPVVSSNNHTFYNINNSFKPCLWKHNVTKHINNLHVLSEIILQPACISSISLLLYEILCRATLHSFWIIIYFCKSLNTHLNYF